MIVSFSRRAVIAALAGLLVPLRASARGLFAPHAEAALRQFFIDRAFEMKRLAESMGDQGYGAVVVRGRGIVSESPSRVVVKKDATAHAEREALRDAQAKLGKDDLSDCVMYSTSRPCAACERAAAQVKLSRMYYGPQGADAGVPSA